MPNLRLDNIIHTSLVDTYLNYATPKTNIVLSGLVANGNTVNFTGTIPYSRSNTRADIYAKNLNTGEKRPTSGGSSQSPYQFVSTETASVLVNYDGSNINITFSIFNGTGVDITLTSQTMEMTAAEYQVPF